MIHCTFWHVRPMIKISQHLSDWSLFVNMKKPCILGYPKCNQWRFWSDCTNLQAVLNLCLSHIRKQVFSDVAAQLYIILSKYCVRMCVTILKAWSDYFWADWIESVLLTVSYPEIGLLDASWNLNHKKGALMMRSVYAQNQQSLHHDNWVLHRTDRQPLKMKTHLKNKWYKHCILIFACVFQR